jgi:hypothetical protein
MKKQLLTLAFVAAATVASYAQGTITFANTIASRIQLDADGSGPGQAVNVPGAAALNYGVFWGAAGAAESALVLNEGALGTAHATSAGLIAAGSPYVIQGAAELSTVSIQIRAWSSSFGRDWELAKRTDGALFGQTDVRQVRLAATAGPGTIIWQSATATAADRFNPFTVSPVVIPEPSTIALAVLGLGSLLLFRRRK